jgi:HK97 family phage prohead protease
MSPDTSIERRAVLELRADRQRLVGHAVVFDTRSADLGGFVEIIRPSAVDRALAPGVDVRCLYNHDPGAVLGRTPKTLTLTKDARGLAFTLDPAPTQAGHDALALVQRGDLTGASFGFRTLKDAWRNDAGIVVRELLDLEIVEISLTPFPSYQQTDVSVAQRALTGFRNNPLIKPISVYSPSSVSWLRLRERVR